MMEADKTHLVGDQSSFHRETERWLEAPFESPGLGSTANEILKASRRGEPNKRKWMKGLRFGDGNRQALTAVLGLQDIPWKGLGLYMRRVTQTGLRSLKSAEDERAARSGGLSAQGIFIAPYQDRQIQLILKQFTSGQDALAMHLRNTESTAHRLENWEVTSAVTLPESRKTRDENIAYGEIRVRKPLGTRSLRLAGKSVSSDSAIVIFEAPIDNPWDWPDLSLVALRQLEKMKGQVSSFG